MNERSNIRRRVKFIYEKRQELLDELDEIIKKCPHIQYRIGKWSWRVGNIDDRRICTDCEHTLPGSPSNEEIKQFNSENNNGQGRKIYYTQDADYIKPFSCFTPEQEEKRQKLTDVIKERK